MKLPTLELTKRQRRIVRVALGLMALVPLAYIGRFICRPLSSDSGDWGTFGDYFGGILNPIISLLTLIVTVYIAHYLQKADDARSEREKRLAYNPQLAISIDRAYVHSIQRDEGFLMPVEVLTKNVPYPQYTYSGRSAVSIPLLNLGLGVAKKVEITVQYDVDAIIQLLMTMNERHPQYKVNITHQPAEGIIVFHGPGHNVGADRINLHKFSKVHHVLSLTDSPLPTEVKLPPALISLFLTYAYHCRTYDIADPNMPKFPPFLIKVEYQDLENGVHKDEFDVELLFSGGAPAFKTTFQILITDRKIQ